jgi:hypothetical protein
MKRILKESTGVNTVNKFVNALSNYFSNDTISHYPGLVKRHGQPESLEYVIDCANHRVMFDSKDELDTIDMRRL